MNDSEEFSGHDEGITNENQRSVARIAGLHLIDEEPALGDEGRDNAQHDENFSPKSFYVNREPNAQEQEKAEVEAAIAQYKQSCSRKIGLHSIQE